MAIAFLVAPAAAGDAVAPEAARYRRPLIQEVQRVWGLIDPSLFFGQVHQESRFNETARSRFAAGIAQFTPATAAEMQRMYPADLQEECAEAGGCPFSPKWALRAMNIYDRKLWLRAAYAATEEDRWAFMLAGYNGGEGWIDRERAACLGRPGCDSTSWFGGVDKVCLRADWACAENRGYPRMIMFRWRPLYRTWLGR